MVNPAFSESQLKNLRRQNRHLASTHRRKLVFLQASRNPAHGSGRPFFVRDVPVPASFCSAPVASAFAPPAPVSAAPQLRPFCLSPPVLMKKRLPDRISSSENRVCRTKRRCKRNGGANEKRLSELVRQPLLPAAKPAPAFRAAFHTAFRAQCECPSAARARRPCPPASRVRIQPRAAG